MNREARLAERNEWFHGSVIMELKRHMKKLEYYKRIGVIDGDYASNLLEIIDIDKKYENRSTLEVLSAAEL